MIKLYFNQHNLSVKVYINEKKKRKLVGNQQVCAFLLPGTCFMLTENYRIYIHKKEKKTTFFLTRLFFLQGINTLIIPRSLPKERNNMYLPSKDIRDIMLYKREGPFIKKR